MLPSFEHVQPAKASAWFHHVRIEDSFAFLWHFHEEFELTLITSGLGSRFIGDSIESYEPGDVTLIGPNVPHTFASAPGSTGSGAVVMQFRRDFLGDQFFDSPDLAPIADLLTRADRAVAFDRRVGTKIRSTAQALSRVDPCERTIMLLEILATLAAERHYRLLVGEEYSPTLTARARQRVDAVCQYVHANYNRPIDFSTVAGIAHLSPAAFSRFFRRTMGRTLTAYINELRVSGACQLLVETDLSIADIAVRSGYENLSNFNRRFRQLKHMSPSEYRTRFFGAASPSWAEPATGGAVPGKPEPLLRA